MMFDVTPEALQFRAVNDKGQEIDSGIIATANVATANKVVMARPLRSVGNYQLILR